MNWRVLIVIAAAAIVIYLASQSSSTGVLVPQPVSAGPTPAPGAPGRGFTIGPIFNQPTPGYPVPGASPIVSRTVFPLHTTPTAQPGTPISTSRVISGWQSISQPSGDAGPSVGSLPTPRVLVSPSNPPLAIAAPGIGSFETRINTSLAPGAHATLGRMVY